MFTIRRLRQSEHTSAPTRRAAMLGAILASGILAMPVSAQARPVSNTTSGAPAAAATPSVEAIRAATERFRDVRVALAEGYLRDPASMIRSHCWRSCTCIDYRHTHVTARQSPARPMSRCRACCSSRPEET